MTMYAMLNLIVVTSVSYVVLIKTAHLWTFFSPLFTRVLFPVIRATVRIFKLSIFGYTHKLFPTALPDIPARDLERQSSFRKPVLIENGQIIYSK